jgi:hypothetical protein
MEGSSPQSAVEQSRDEDIDLRGNAIRGQGITDRAPLCREICPFPQFDEASDAFSFDSSVGE